jgi:hypothetical protein
VPKSPRRSTNTMRHIVTNLVAWHRVGLSRRFCELAVFYVRLYIRVRGINGRAQRARLWPFPVLQERTGPAKTVLLGWECPMSLAMRTPRRQSLNC